MRPYLFDRLDDAAPVVNRRPLGVFLDFDGTLAPMAPTPDTARIDPDCKESLALLAPRIALTAVVSGRRADEIHRLVGIDGVVCSGNHGLERWQDGSVALRPEAAAAQESITRVRREVEAVAVKHNVYVEDKGPIVAFHYRPAPDRERARQALLRELEPRAREHGLTLYEGIALIELRPRLPLSKGTAVRELATEHRLTAAVFLGDDMTDLDAFAALKTLACEQGVAVLCVAVAHGETPREVLDAADYVVRGVADVARALRWMATAAE